MSGIFPLILTALTSAGAYGLARFAFGHRARFQLGLQRTLETIGLAVIFFAVNVGVATAGILFLRTLGRFISLYIATDYTLLALSCLQAVLFQHWWYSGKKDTTP